MKNMYDIAAIGESMAGKSTWIANLFREDITKKLKGLCELNQEGQTKIALFYILGDPNDRDFEIQYINWNLDMLVKKLKDKDYPKSLQKLIGLFNIPIDFNFEENDIDADIHNVLDEYFKSDRYIRCLKALQIVDFISSFINNSALSELGVITHVEVVGAADKDVWDTIKEFGLDGVKIRDTRGFLDETEDKMIEFLEQSKQMNKANEAIINEKYESSDENTTYIQKLLDDRGVYGVDACVFMSVSGANTLSKKNNRAIYGPLIKNMIEKHPMFLVVRADKMTEVYVDNPGISYEDSILKDENGNYIRIGRYFSGFNDLHSLLKAYGLLDKSEDYRVDIARKHYTELLLANIPFDVSIEEIEMLENIYRKSVIGVFTEVLKGVREYYHNIEEAERCLEAIKGDQRALLKKLYDNEFNSNIFFYSTTWGYANYKLRYVTKYLSNKVKGPYYRGLVGACGGLTTWINGEGRVGKAAIDFLETAYRMRKELLSKMVDELEPEIKSYLNTRLEQNIDITSEVDEMKKKILIKFEKDSDNDFERLFCTQRMIPRKYLKDAYDRTRVDLDVTDKYIGKYLEDLENYYQDESWRTDRHQISVVKWMLWNLICYK